MGADLPLIFQAGSWAYRHRHCMAWWLVPPDKMCGREGRLLLMQSIEEDSFLCLSPLFPCVMVWQECKGSPDMVCDGEKGRRKQVYLKLRFLSGFVYRYFSCFSFFSLAELWDQQLLTLVRLHLHTNLQKVTWKMYGFSSIGQDSGRRSAKRKKKQCIKCALIVS